MSAKVNCQKMKMEIYKHFTCVFKNLHFSIPVIFQKIQQLVGPLPGDGGLENVDKFLFAGHGVPP